MPPRRVLVTGAAGYIAGQLLPALRERYELVLVDVRATDRHGRTVEGTHLADLTDPDLDRHRPLFEGVDAVVHLGYRHPTGDRTAPAAYYVERSNIDMAFHVYQLSLETGVKRVVVASSNHAADWYEHLIHAGLKDVVDPWERAVSDNYYGWAKEAYEHLGFVFASGRLGRALEVVQIRIGAPREIEASRFVGNPVGYHRDLGAYISERDLQQLFLRAIEAEEIRDAYGIPFQIVYGVSANARRFWSLTSAVEVLGYSPADDSEVRFAEAVREILAPLGGPVPARAYPPSPGDPEDPSRPGRS